MISLFSGSGEAADCDAKGLRLILLSCLFPLAVYLLLLGFLNRRSHPLLISGIWDGIGLLFGVSGFLLFAGPAVLSALNERWRLFWLLGKNAPSLAAAEGASQLWIFLSLLYFVLIVGGAVYFLVRQRQLTAIYNADTAQVERALLDVCEQLGFNPVRSGEMFLFGQPLGFVSDPGGNRPEFASPDNQAPVITANSGLEQPAMLSVDSFPLLRHVTLRWQPADAQCRRVIESELSRYLLEQDSGDSLVGGWLITLGLVLLSFNLTGTFFLIALNLFLR